MQDREELSMTMRSKIRQPDSLLTDISSLEYGKLAAPKPRPIQIFYEYLLFMSLSDQPDSKFLDDSFPGCKVSPPSLNKHS